MGDRREAPPPAPASSLGGNGAKPPETVMPGEIAKAIALFSTLKLSGHVQINFRNGEIMGYHSHRIVSLNSQR